MTHKELVDKAKRWLLISKGCNPVFTEKGSANISEMPDAIGWTANDCFVVECKTSVADFRNDKKKYFRINETGLGNYRYYLMPSEVYDKTYNEISENWGHLIIRSYENFPQQVRLKGSKEHKRNLLNEVYYLRSRILEIQRFGM